MIHYADLSPAAVMSMPAEFKAELENNGPVYVPMNESWIVPDRLRTTLGLKLPSTLILVEGVNTEGACPVAWFKAYLPSNRDDEIHGSCAIFCVGQESNMSQEHEGLN